MRLWIKLLPFFIVEWLAVQYGAVYHVNGWTYTQPFGPGDRKARRRSVLIEIDPAERPDWNIQDEEENVANASSSLEITKMRYGAKDTGHAD